MIRRITQVLGISMLVCMGASAQSEYYWANGKKIFLERKDKEYVLYEKDKQKSLKKGAVNAEILVEGTEPAHGFLKKMKDVEYKTHAYALKKASGKNQKKTADESAVYTAPVFKTQDGSDLIMTNFFYVRLSDKKDLSLLKATAAKYGATILGSNTTDESWYLLSCLGSGKNALELANLFYETGYFEFAEPELIAPLKKSCYNDPMFSTQWNANNTGQYGSTPGPDINLCEAHAYAKGNNVVVSVLDEGVQYGHPDLPNLTSYRVWADYSAEDGVNGDHGMQCAGVIGAQEGNGIGMVGVAPDCQIMPSAIVFDGLFATWPWGIAAVVNLSWQGGADIISNSWHSTWTSSVTSSAFVNAMENGRDGLGTVIVFATGNDDNNGINFPANSDDRILTVGAMSPCGERKNPSSCDGENWWGSNYGTKLDIVAPGVKIPTVNLDGTYNNYFNGTSSATPHVAGVAALILSVNPDLTMEEVTDIIESTAQKVGGYSYQNTSGRNNGTWNNEMGYGLLDAEAAVIAALPTPPLFDTYNVPRPSGIPTGFRQYSYVHTIGSGGPNLSNVFNSVFNWWGDQYNPNGLYQFTLETNNGQPRSYTNITDYGSYNLYNSSPEITINPSIGFPGLEGDYWVNLDGSNLVLVEKSGTYALYFSNSSTAPQAKISEIAHTTSMEDLHVAPNPFTGSTLVMLTDDQLPGDIYVYNSIGVLVEEIKASSNEITVGEGYESGVYIIHVNTPTGLIKQVIVKQ